ncbi:M48 family metallopeptidase [Ilumatobacter nonamiensis]|uniref:M48 family metallopeptidase n=1 Tax=Ilumatobacter nonamiensis TaxID=467093 RepID=UPI0003449331|nr:M48 family metallopeptidase [Ilumatobacter nonamiensis]
MSDIVNSNKRRSVALVVGFLVVAAVVGALVGLVAGEVLVVAVAFVAVAAVYLAVSFRMVESIALRVGRAEPVDATDQPRLHNVVDGLCITGGLPKPAVHVVDDPAPNAFVVGRSPNHAAIAMTSGLLETLERVELEGVVAQQLSQVKNHDTLVASLAVTVIAPISLLADVLIRKKWWNGGRVERAGDQGERSNPLAYIGFGLLAFSPLTGWLMRTVIPPSRETLADMSACQVTRYPPGLIAALEKMNKDVTVTHSATTATAHLWIEQPLSGVGDAGKLGSVHKLFDTHPPLEERIALLREL